MVPLVPYSLSFPYKCFASICCLNLLSSWLATYNIYMCVYTYAVCTRLHPMHIFCGHTAQIGRSNPHGRPRLALFFMLHFVDYAARQIKSKSSSIHILLSFLKSVIRNMYKCNIHMCVHMHMLHICVYIYIRVYRIVWQTVHPKVYVVSLMFFHLTMAILWHSHGQAKAPLVRSSRPRSKPLMRFARWNGYLCRKQARIKYWLCFLMFPVVQHFGNL